MTDTEKTEFWFRASLEEYRTLRAEMLLFLANFRRDTTVLGAVLGASLTVTAASPDAASWQVQAVLAGLPSVIFAYLLLQISNLYMLLVEARRCAAIEKSIKLKLEGDAPMRWESQYAERNVRDIRTPIGVATTALNVALISLHIGLTIFASSQNYWWGKTVMIAHICEIVVILACFGMYLSHQQRSDKHLATTQA